MSGNLEFQWQIRNSEHLKTHSNASEWFFVSWGMTHIYIFTRSIFIRDQSFIKTQKYKSFPFILLNASIKSWVKRESQDLFHQLYLFTQERMKVICALGTHKHFMISETCWIFNILMFHVIIFNIENQLKTYKIQLQFILVLSKSKIVE